MVGDMDIHFLKQQHEQLQRGMQQIEDNLGELLRQKQRQIGAIQMIEVLIKAEGERDEEQTNSDIDGTVVDSDASAVTSTDTNADG
jgi:hypothetical protein